MRKWTLPLIRAIFRREPWGHIKDLWDLFRGVAVVRGKPPYEYLLNIKGGSK